MKASTWLFWLAGSVATAWAVETQFWSQKDHAAYERAKLTGLSLSSEGRITLAPVVRPLLDSRSTYLWSLALDSKGNLYAGGGGPGSSAAAVYLIPAGGQSRVLAELEGLEIHALAVDSQDRVYAATSPDGRVYRLAADGKAELFYDPKAKYIWDMLFDRQGRLYVATGDRGQIHRVTPDGRGGVWFSVIDTHVRALALDARDNLIVGTEPGGMILRVTPQGEAFVLYQAPKREITAVAVAPDGSIYAAGVGARQPPAPAPAPVPPTPQPSPLPGSPATPQQAARPAPAPSALPPLTASAAAVTGGSEIYRIDREGFTQKLWSHPQDIAYSIAFDASGRALIGTGNKGTVYRVDSDRLWTALLNLQPTQVTRLLAGRGGVVYVATGNIGQVYALGPELEKEGSVESQPFDAGLFSYWGRLMLRGALNGGEIVAATRSGNLERPQQHWSPWSDPIPWPGGLVTSPSARFLQWRITLRARGSHSPELESVEVAYRNRNVAPAIQQIEITPANYRVPPQTLALTPSQTITLPPLGRPARTTPAAPTADSGSLSLQYAKGYIGARWAASDENGDALSFRVEIRGEQEGQWKLLKDKLREKHLSWDSTAFPDGRYRLRIIATDAPDNPPDDALSAELTSDVFLIDNTPPEITELQASLTERGIRVRFRARDALNVVARAECSINGGDWLLIEPRDRLADSEVEEYEAVLPKPEGSEFAVAVRATDDYDNQVVAKVVVRP